MECRICLEQERPLEDRLLAPCNCSGTMRYIHEKCFQKWLEHITKGKTYRERKNMLSYFHC